MLITIDHYDHASAGFNSLMCNSESRSMLNGGHRPVIAMTDEEESKNNNPMNVEKIQTAIPADSNKSNAWPAHYQERYPGTFMYHFNLTLNRQAKLTWRDRTFIYSRVGQCVIVGAIAGSLFSSMAPEDTTTRAGFLFYVILFNAFASFAMIPLCYDQKAVYYKHADALFFPTSAFVVAQTLVLFPLQLLETIIFGVIMYWSAGFSSEANGSRFLSFQVMLFTFAVACAQLFRLFACLMPNVATAFPMAGVGVILMVLFSGIPCEMLHTMILQITHDSILRSPNLCFSLSLSFSFSF
jgi:ABC-2 type transporter